MDRDSWKGVTERAGSDLALLPLGLWSKMGILTALLPRKQMHFGVGALYITSNLGHTLCADAAVWASAPPVIHCID